MMNEDRNNLLACAENIRNMIGLVMDCWHKTFEGHIN